ncbi:hypothetical protein PO909_013598, partial [Leuciscus waleckii]
TGERVGRAVPAAPGIPGGSSATRGGRPGRLSLPGQQLLDGGQIPGARRLQQLLLLPHLTHTHTSGGGTITRSATRTHGSLSDAPTHSLPAPLRSVHQRRLCQGYSRSNRSCSGETFSPSARTNFLWQRLDTSLPRRARSLVTSRGLGIMHNHLITLMMVEWHLGN